MNSNCLTTGNSRLSSLNLKSEERNIKTRKMEQKKNKKRTKVQRKEKEEVNGKGIVASLHVVEAKALKEDAFLHLF